MGHFRFTGQFANYYIKWKSAPISTRISKQFRLNVCLHEECVGPTRALCPNAFKALHRMYFLRYVRYTYALCTIYFMLCQIYFMLCVRYNLYFVSDTLYDLCPIHFMLCVRYNLYFLFDIICTLCPI